HGPGQRERGLRGEEVGDVVDPAHLPVCGSGQVRAAVTQRIHGDTAGKIQVFAAGNVFQPHAVPFANHEQLAAILPGEGEIHLHPLALLARLLNLLHFHSRVPCFPSRSRTREPAPSYCPMITFCTPPFIASSDAVTFGIMPPLITPFAMSALASSAERAWTMLPSERIPGISERNTSADAPM